MVERLLAILPGQLSGFWKKRLNFLLDRPVYLTLRVSDAYLASPDYPFSQSL
jgi:hypothetical protein